jgi:hypothetical protein
MPAMAIRTDGILGDVSTIFTLRACPFPAKGFYYLWILVVPRVTLFTHSLNFSAAIENIRRRHHAFIVHVVNGPAVTMGAGDTFGHMASDGIVFGEIQMAYQA